MQRFFLKMNLLALHARLLRCAAAHFRVRNICPGTICTKNGYLGPNAHTAPSPAQTLVIFVRITNLPHPRKLHAMPYMLTWLGQAHG